MTAPRRAAIGLLIVVLGGGAVACGDDGTQLEGTVQPRATDFEPTAFARAEIPPQRLDLYRQIGRVQGLDWSVLAAAAQLDRVTGEQPIRALSLSLLSFGAPGDYSTALSAYSDRPGFTQRALALSDRYRGGPAGTEPPEPTSGALQQPAAGTVYARYGTAFGAIHDGIDVAAKAAEPIDAAAAGVVTFTGATAAYGNYTCIWHRFDPALRGSVDLSTCYGNQSHYATEPGTAVRRGELIGYIGCSGPCSASHVHFQVRRGPSHTSPAVDPLLYMQRPELGPDRRPLDVPGGR